MNDEQNEYNHYTAMIKSGYNQVAEAYRKQKDKHQISLPPYQQFSSEISKNVLELGCGSGFPVAEDLIKKKIDYVGIDISEKQIKLAQQTYPQLKDHFIVADIIRYLKQLPDESFSGVISLFTIFHIPRNKHVLLFEEIHRVLQSDGLILFTAHPTHWVGTEPDFFGTEMKWSNFSHRYYQVMLPQLGFKLKQIYYDIAKFNGKQEYTYYLLYQK